MGTGPLYGIKVLDIGHYLAGPWCTRLLGQMGAEVTKVERPTGDPLRKMNPCITRNDGTKANASFLFANVGKSSITLNLKTAKGRAMFLNLINESDVVVENYAPGVLEHLDLGYESLKKINPGIILTSISNFGQTGPYRNYKASELTLYATGGMMSISGLQGQEPLKHGLFTQAQYAAGTIAAFATLTALSLRRISGIGNWVDVSIMETLASELIAGHCYYAYSGAIQARQRRQDINIDGRTGPLETRDGWIIPSLGLSDGSTEWESFVNLMLSPALLQKRFHTHVERIKNADDLADIIRTAIQEKGKYELFHEANTWRFAWGVSQKLRELLQCPQLNDRGFFERIHEGRIPGLPFRPFRPWEYSTSPPPSLGEHNSQVYSNLFGLTRRKIQNLREQGVV